MTFGREHLLLQPTYQAMQKAVSFEWGWEQKTALQHLQAAKHTALPLGTYHTAGETMLESFSGREECYLELLASAERWAQILEQRLMCSVDNHSLIEKEILGLSCVGHLLMSHQDTTWPKLSILSWVGSDHKVMKVRVHSSAPSLNCPGICETDPGLTQISYSRRTQCLWSPLLLPCLFFQP